MTILPTLTLASAARSTWDAVVVGAGPAGALAARQLALAGAQTLLVDRSGFPRAKVCGACVNGHALAVLHSVGLGTLLSELAGRPFGEFEVHSAGRTVRLSLPAGAAVSRERLDAALVRAAITAGAAFLPETSGALCPLDTTPVTCREVELTRAHGSRETQRIQARIAVAAGGLGHSRSLPAGEFRSQTAARARVGLGAVLPDPHGYEPGTIFMAVGNGGYVGLVRIEGEALNVAAAVDPDIVRRSGGPAAAVERLFREAGLRPIPLASAPWTGTRPLTQRTRPLAAERVFLLGDAAGYVEPFTGEGIAWALTAAVAVVPLAREALAGWDRRLAQRWAGVYRRRLAGRQRLCRLVAACVHHPRLVRFLLGAFSLSPRLAGPLIARISGSPARLEAYCS